MLTQFEHFQTVDIPLMNKLIVGMNEFLEALDEGLIPNRVDYSQDDLSAFLSSLVRGQRGSLGRTNAGSWSVAPNDDGMDSDARVAFIFRPTYLAAAILTRSLCEYPLVALSISGYREALNAGLLFCSNRALRGHGFDADAGAIESLRVLALGKVPWLLLRHPDFCPELKAAIDDVAMDMAQRLAKGTAVGTWGEDYSEGFRSAIETLRLKNDPDFMQSLDDARKDSTTISIEDLPW